MKRINKKDYARLLALRDRLATAISDPSVQSERIWRGDIRAIQWAAWWIRETVAEQEQS